MDSKSSSAMKMFGGRGNDLLYGAAGNDRLEGDHGDDALFGGEDTAVLIGGDDDDILSGGDVEINLRHTWAEFWSKALVNDGDGDVLFGRGGNDIFLIGDKNALGNYADFAFGNWEDAEFKFRWLFSPNNPLPGQIMDRIGHAS